MLFRKNTIHMERLQKITDGKIHGIGFRWWKLLGIIGLKDNGGKGGGSSKSKGKLICKL